MTLIINEVLFDPAADAPGDANGDGVRSSSADEFIEIVNTGTEAVDISGFTLSDDDGGDFTFPANTTLAAGQAAVLFGGGTPTGNFGGALVFTDDGSIGSGLGNSGDLVELRDAGGTLIDSFAYGNAGTITGGSDQSITRNPDLTGEFADHSVADTADNSLFSPGTQINGDPFAGGAAPQATVINDVLFSTIDADVEFVELFGTPGASLEGLSLISFNANSAEAGDLNLQIDFTAGQVLGDNGFLLLGNDLVSGAFGVTPNILLTDSFENDDQIFALVQTDTLVVNGGTVVDDANTIVVDGVGFSDADGDFTNFFNLPTVGPDGTFLAPGGVRNTDGVDTDSASDFAIGNFNIGAPNSPTAGTGLDGGDSAVMATAVTIPEIQGAGHISPFVDQVVVTTGIVTAVVSNGFYFQDATGDGNDATSDGVFVFTGSAPTVTAGDEVTVTGTVSEFIPGGAGTGNLSTTQITSVVDVNIVSSGNALPDAVIIGQAGRTPPTDVVISESELPVNLQDVPGTFNPDVDGIDFFESLEGQLVTIDDPVAVSATNQFGETFTVVDDGANVTSGSPDGGLNDRGG